MRNVKKLQKLVAFDSFALTDLESAGTGAGMKNVSVFFVLSAALLGSWVFAAPVPRIWTNTNGRTVTATMVGKSETTVSLMATGSRIPAVVPLASLSEADREYVANTPLKSAPPPTPKPTAIPLLRFQSEIEVEFPAGYVFFDDTESSVWIIRAAAADQASPQEGDILDKIPARLDYYEKKHRAFGTVETVNSPLVPGERVVFRLNFYAKGEDTPFRTVVLDSDAQKLARPKDGIIRGRELKYELKKRDLR